MEPILPIWTDNTERLIRDIISSGFRSIVVSTRKDILGEEWLGREIDDNFIKDVSTIGSIDLCGEKGEFHTFTYDGPLFKERVKFNKGEKRMEKEHWFLEIY